MEPWDGAFERSCAAHVEGVVGDGPDPERHWQALLVKIAPRIERWAARSRVLARWRLASEDDVRAVLVAVLSRLAHDGHAALRRLHARAAIDESTDDDQRSAVERLARLTAPTIEDGEPIGPDGDHLDGTPVRALVRVLVRRAVADHVRYRLGWTDAGGRRVVGTDAARLSEVPEGSARPAMTDFLTASQLLGEIARFTATFPPPMQGALRLWMGDASFAAIAATLTLDDEEAARKLVRAAHARLRERFRGEWAALF